LPAVLAQIHRRRSRRGIRRPLTVVITAAVTAIVAGYRSLRGDREWVADLPVDAAVALGIDTGRRTVQGHDPQTASSPRPRCDRRGDRHVARRTDSRDIKRIQRSDRCGRQTLCGPPARTWLPDTSWPPPSTAPESYSPALTSTSRPTRCARFGPLLDYNRRPTRCGRGRRCVGLSARPHHLARRGAQ